MRALLIDPFTCRVRDYELPDAPTLGEAWELMAEVYRALSHDTAAVDSLDGVLLGATDFLLVDGHGMVRDPPVQRWFRLNGLHHETLAGKGLIVGRKPDSSETDTTFAIEDVDYRAAFFRRMGASLVQTVTPWRPQQ